MVAGYLYDVDFYVSLNDGYIQAIEELGAYLSVTPPGPFPNALHLNLVPQVEHNNGTITDTTGWKHVYGQFMASGGEQYITIGNFHDDAGTTITQPGTTGSYGAYYFVDDVSVTLADSTTGISENPAAGFFVSYQNGALQIAIEPGVAGRMEIHDMSGRLVFIKENVSGIVNANLPAISGIYTVSLLTENKIYHRKISRPALK